MDHQSLCRLPLSLSSHRLCMITNNLNSSWAQHSKGLFLAHTKSTTNVSNSQDRAMVLYKFIPRSGPFSHHGKGEERVGESSH